MMQQFLNDATDIEWLKAVHLRNVTLPAAWADFQSYLIYGNESSPDRVDLYMAYEPDMDHDYLRIHFDGDTVHVYEAGVQS